MGDNKQWKGRKRQEGMWGGIIYWETAYPSFLIVLVWLGFYLPFPPPPFPSFILSCFLLLWGPALLLLCYLMIGFRALLPVSICSLCFAGKGWKRKFPGFKFSTTVIFLWMGLSLVFICDLLSIGLVMWYSRDLTLFPESLFSIRVSLSLFRMMWIWKRLRSNFLKGSSTWKPDG